MSLHENIVYSKLYKPKLTFRLVLYLSYFWNWGSYPSQTINSNHHGKWIQDSTSEMRLKLLSLSIISTGVVFKMQHNSLLINNWCNFTVPVAYVVNLTKPRFLLQWWYYGKYNKVYSPYFCGNLDSQLLTTYVCYHIKRIQSLFCYMPQIYSQYFIKYI